MSGLTGRLITTDQYTRAMDSMTLYTPMLALTLSKGEGVIQTLDVQGMDVSSGIVVTSPMDIHQKGEEIQQLPNPPDDLQMIALSVNPLRQKGLEYHYNPDILNRWNEEFSGTFAADSFDIFVTGKIGHLADFGYAKTQLRDAVTIYIEGSGDSGSLEPDDPTQPPDEPPYDPGDDPGHTVVGGGLEEVTVIVNPNSMYTIKLKSAKGVEITGVEGLDRTMSWDFATKTLTGGVLGTSPKKVIVKLGDSSANLYIKAEPVSRHLI